MQGCVIYKKNFERNTISAFKFWLVSVSKAVMSRCFNFDSEMSLQENDLSFYFWPTYPRLNYYQVNKSSISTQKTEYLFFWTWENFAEVFWGDLTKFSFFYPYSKCHFCFDLAKVTFLIYQVATLALAAAAYQLGTNLPKTKFSRTRHLVFLIYF